MENMQYDVFICHASEDKKDFVRPLAELLQQQHLEVWYDEFSLNVGDSLSQKIDEGLSNSRFGIVVLSPNFFKKPWAKRELSGLTLREMVEKKNLILPIWHRVSVEDVLTFSPPLADKKASSSEEGINSLIRDLMKKIKPQQSPLLVAKEYLNNLDVDSPAISDEWWLDIIEYKEFLKFPYLNHNKRWIFPLPYPDDDFGSNRGINIASTVLQLDWSFEGEELNISPITHPDKVHEFIHRWSGLYECARENPEILALYVPQLTIQGFDNGFDDLFDELLNSNDSRSNIIFSYGGLETIFNEKPLCGNIVALRHPTFGNYTKRELASTYFQAHDTTYSRSTIDAFEGLVWLLSKDADWLPEKHRSMFVEGTITENDQWYRENLDNEENYFIRALLEKNKKEFSFTKTIKTDLERLITDAINELGIQDSSSSVLEKMLSLDLVNKYYDYLDWLKEMRNKIKTMNNT